ncbi:MAG: formate dehydrogenase subunit gamma [Deltaproteobacteria bacterium]|nr:formate dehydrogenase subunit gamma [Deltaproteobacteria bacterium]
MEKGMIKVSTTFERLLHWYLALTCLMLIFSGLGMMFHSFNFIAVPFGGLKNLKLVHNYTGLFFIPALLLTAFNWWKEAGTFDLPDDIEWLRKAGGYLWKVDRIPETGKYNPGQKVFFLTVVIVGLAMIGSGLLMLYPEGQSKELINWMYALHACGVVALLPFIVVHIYLGTVGVPGSAALVYTGYTSRAWCLSQCPKWLRKKEEDGTLEIFIGE